MRRKQRKPGKSNGEPLPVDSGVAEMGERAASEDREKTASPAAGHSPAPAHSQAHTPAHSPAHSPAHNGGMELPTLPPQTQHHTLNGHSSNSNRPLDSDSVTSLATTLTTTIAAAHAHLAKAQESANNAHATEPTMLPCIPEIISDNVIEPLMVTRQEAGIEAQQKPPYKGVMVPCGQLKDYLDSLTTFNRKCMLRKGREVHKIYVDLRKGETFLDDQFSYTEFGRMVLTNGSIRAGRAKNAKQIVVARETLYCSGTTACKRACGGYGSCLSGCDKTKMRGHRCSYRIKLTQRLGFVNHWFVEELGSHGQFGKNKSEPPTTSSMTAKQTKSVAQLIGSKKSQVKPKREIKPMPERPGVLSNGGVDVGGGEAGSNYHYVLGLMPTSSPSSGSPSRSSPGLAHTEQPQDLSKLPSSQIHPAQHISLPDSSAAAAAAAAQTALSVAIATNTIPSQLSSMMPNLPLNLVNYLPQMQDPSVLNPFLVKVKQESSDEGPNSTFYPGGVPLTGPVPFSPSQVSNSHSPSPARGAQGMADKTPPSQDSSASASIDLKLNSENSQKMQAHHETLGQVHNRIMERAKMRKSAQTVRVQPKISPVETEAGHDIISNIPHNLVAHEVQDGKHVSEAVLNRFQTLNHILQSAAFQEAKSQLEGRKVARGPGASPGDQQQQETALNLTVKPEQPSEDSSQSPYFQLAQEWKQEGQLHTAQQLSLLVNGVKDEDVAMETDSHELTDNEKELMCRVRQLESHVKQLQNIVIKRDDGPGGQTASGSRRKKAQREFDFSKYNTRHVALRILYLGFDYLGFASQEETDKTIEAVLFDALKKTRLIESRETSSYHRCGRTDKGVSAFSQVISIDLRTNLLEGVGVKVREGGTAHERPGEKQSEIRYCHILNKVLPPEIRVLAWAPVNTDFSARFSCTRRTYKYIFPKSNADVKEMNVAAQKLVGEHDFRNLCKMDVGNGVTNFVRRIYSVELVTLGGEDDESGYSMVELTVVGSGFLWHQIRCIVTALLLVGQGKEKPEIIDELLDVAKNPRKPQYTMASELPLCLYDTEFGDDFEWIYEADWHEDNIRTLQQLWAQHAVKASMIRCMLGDLDKAKVETECDIAPWSDLSPPLYGQADWLLPGNKTRVYRPLMERQTAESLESRIEFYAKKRKLNSGAEAPPAETAEAE